MENEEWRWVPNWPAYEVSDQGRVRGHWTNSLREGLREIGSESILLSPDEVMGYFQVTLYHFGLCKRFKVHKLVLETFVGPCPPGMEARHLDGNRKRNYLSNLCWGTKKENQKDRLIHGTSVLGSGNGRALLSEEDVKEIKRLLRKNELTVTEIAEQFCVKRSVIYDIKQGRSWSHVK